MPYFIRPHGLHHTAHSRDKSAIPDPKLHGQQGLYNALGAVAKRTTQGQYTQAWAQLREAAKTLQALEKNYSKHPLQLQDLALPGDLASPPSEVDWSYTGVPLFDKEPSK